MTTREKILLSRFIAKDNPVMYLRYVNDEVKVIYVKFNDQNAGQ